MTVIEDVIVPHNTGSSFVVKKGQRIRVIAESTVDFVVFNLDNLTERFDQARTKSNQRKIYISTGDVLYSKLNKIMMTIVEDTYKGTHDLQFGMCSKYSRDEQWRRRETPGIKAKFKELGITKREDLPYHGCWENLASALQKYPVLPLDIPSPLNLFQSTEIDANGRMIDRRSRDRPEPGTLVDLRAEMDCLVALSACPDPSLFYKTGKPVKVQVFNK